jgi:serine/threonine protein kinase
MAVACPPRSKGGNLLVDAGTIAIVKSQMTVGTESKHTLQTTGGSMSFIQCECGERIEFGRQPARVVCPSCGNRFTWYAVENDIRDAEVTQGPVDTPLTATMLQDLPAVTQFENRWGDSIIASALGAGAAILAGAPAMAPKGSGTPNVPANTDTENRSTPSNDASNCQSRTRSDERQTVELQLGSRLLDRYEIHREVGQGGMSTVYEAYDDVRGEKVALKILLPHLAVKKHFRERFLQEGRISSNFSHSDIARVYDLHQTDGRIFLSMELLHGSTLRHDMNRRKDQRQSYRPVEVLEMLKHVSQALTVVHDQKVVHRDLKPENLWLSLNGSVKVMDFGIARDDSGTIHTQGGHGSGTPYYIAPEQLASSPNLDGRADQYSIAVIMYELLTGELPQGAVVLPHVKNPAVPRKMSKAIFRALNSDPNLRHPTMRSFYEAARFRTTKSPLTKILTTVSIVLGLLGGGYAFARIVRPLVETKPQPIWAIVDEQSISEHQPLSFSVRHPDASFPNDNLKFELLSDAPQGCTIHPQTGMINWTPSEAQGPKKYTFTAIVEGDKIAPKRQPFTVIVRERVDQPEMLPMEQAVAKEHQPFNISIKANDPNEPKFGLVYALPNPVAGMAIDPRTGELQWTPTEEHGEQVVKIPVRVYLDGDEHRQIFSEQTLMVLVQETIDPPQFTSATKLDARVSQQLQFRATVRDSNVPEIGDFFQLGSGHPAGMSIEPATGELFWTPTAEHAGKELEVTVQVCYASGGRSEVLNKQMIKIQVDALDPRPTTPVAVRQFSPAVSTGSRPSGGNNQGAQCESGGNQFLETAGQVLNLIDTIKKQSNRDNSSSSGAKPNKQSYNASGSKTPVLIDEPRRNVNSIFGAQAGSGLHNIKLQSPRTGNNNNYRNYNHVKTPTRRCGH